MLCKNVTASVETQFSKGGHQFRSRSGSVSLKGDIAQPLNTLRDSKVSAN